MGERQWYGKVYYKGNPSKVTVRKLGTIKAILLIIYFFRTTMCRGPLDQE